MLFNDIVSATEVSIVWDRMMIVSDYLPGDTK
jgi:hypothetical protein